MLSNSYKNRIDLIILLNQCLDLNPGDAYSQSFHDFIIQYLEFRKDSFIIKGMRRVYTKFSTLFIVLLMLLMAENLAGLDLKTSRGKIDLSSIDFNTVDGIPLKGEWEIFRGLNQKPTDITDKKEFISLPSFKFPMTNKRMRSNERTTLRVEIQMNREEEGEILGLFIPFIFTPYEIKINGDILHEGFSAIA